MELRIERLRPIFDLLAIALAKRRVQSTHSGRNLVARLLIENIGFVAQEFLCMTQQELAVLNVSGGEHAAESYSINPICKSQSTPPARAAFHLCCHRSVCPLLSVLVACRAS